MIKKLLSYLESDKKRYEKKILNLKKGGVKIGNDVIIHPESIFDANFPYLICIGNNCVIGAESQLIAHDLTMNKFNNNYTKIGQIRIKDNCIISKRAIILPNVTIGPNAIVTAGSIVNKDIPPNTCVAGNPARFYKTFSEFVDEIIEDIRKRPKFDPVDMTKSEDMKDSQRIDEILEATETGPAYIKGFQSRNPFYVKDIKFE